VIDEAELRRMSPQERAELLRALAAIEYPVQPRMAGSERRRVIILAGIIACCVALAIWTGVLAATLPRFYRAGGWRGAWVGFELGLLATFAVTAWAAWRRRQVLIVCLIVLAALLCCDAWFDVTLDVRTSGFVRSLLSALLIELPLAALAVIGARRLLRLTIGMVGPLGGVPGRVPPLWRVPLFAAESHGYRDLIRHHHAPPGIVVPGPRAAEDQDMRDAPGVPRCR